MPQKTNILYLIDHFHGVGGTENHLAQLATSMDKSRFNCIIVAFDFVENHLADRIRKSGIELLHIPVGRYYTFNAFKKAVQLIEVIRREKIDVVQTFHIKSDFYGTLVARLAGVKIIISSKRDVGDLKSSWHFLLNRLVRNIPRKFIVVADAVGKVVVEKEKVSPDKISTIYNGVDIRKFNAPSPLERREARERLGLVDRNFVIGMVAWLRSEKNYNVFFDAIEKVSNKIPDLKVLAVGGDEDGYQLDYFRSYVKRAGTAEDVIFTGQVTDVRPLLKSFNVACLVPGGNEGFSNSIIEKMAMGLPLIVSNVGGNAEAVVDRYNGFVIPPNDVDKLAESILYLFEHPEEREKMGIRSAQRVRELFTLEGMIKAHEQLYESCLLNDT